MTTKKQDHNKDQRRRAVIALVTSNKAVMAQHRDSRAAYERGEPLVPGKLVVDEARARRRSS